MKKFDLKRNLINLLVIFASIFALITINFAAISEFVFNDSNFSNNFLIITITSLIASIVVLFLTKINNISIVVQVIIIYLFLSIVVISLGFILYIYDYKHNIYLLILTIVSLIVGLVLVCSIITFRSKRIDKSLNANLKNFKERDR